MAYSRYVSHKCCYIITVFFVTICGLFAPALFVSGGITYSLDRYAKSVHEPNSCKVMESSYYETRCRGYRLTYVCFRPVWLVTYSIYQDDGTENLLHATIEHDGFRRRAAAEDKQNQYQIGMIYPCWCNVVDPSKARWDEPSVFIGMMLLIFGGVATIVCLVGIFYSYRIRHEVGEFCCKTYP